MSWEDELYEKLKFLVQRLNATEKLDMFSVRLARQRALNTLRDYETYKGQDLRQGDNPPKNKGRFDTKPE